MIQSYTIDANNSLMLCDLDQEACWFHLENPSEEEIQTICEQYGFPQDYLQSTLDPDEVSRFEKLDQVTLNQPALMSFLYPLRAEDQQYINSTLSIILCQDKVITCCKENPEFLINVFDNHFSLIHQIEGLYSIVIELIWRLTRSYVLACRDLTTQMNYLYKQSKKSTKSELIYQLADLDRSIIYMETAIDENEPILDEIETANYLNLSTQYQEWIHDILVENHQAQAMVNQIRQIAQHLDTTFSSVIQNNLNEIMKILTSLTIIITVPTITAGLWGMNVNLPFMSHPWAFWLVLLVTGLIMLGVIIWLKRKDLL